MRRQRYRVRTEIERVDGLPVVRKVADHPDAKPFLDTIIERERLAEGFYRGHAAVSVGRLQGDVIEYDFLPYPTLEQEVEARIRSGDPDRGTKTIRRYLDFLHELPSGELVPREFLASIGASANEIACLCFHAGPMDCIPRNILVDDRAWHVIDHEWMFAHPIPVDLVAYLGVSSLIFGLQDSIRESVDADRPVAIFAGRRQRFYAPVQWLEILSDSILPTPLLNEWYYGFQKKILIDASPRHLRYDRRAYSRIPGRLDPRALISDLGALMRSARRR